MLMEEYPFIADWIAKNTNHSLNPFGYKPTDRKKTVTECQYGKVHKAIGTWNESRSDDDQIPLPKRRGEKIFLSPNFPSDIFVELEDMYPFIVHWIDDNANDPLNPFGQPEAVRKPETLEQHQYTKVHTNIGNMNKNLSDEDQLPLPRKNGEKIFLSPNYPADIWVILEREFPIHQKGLQTAHFHSWNFCTTYRDDAVGEWHGYLSQSPCLFTKEEDERGVKASWWWDC
jgi:hypothetical protein